MKTKLYVEKKSKSLQEFDISYIFNAVDKAAERVMIKLSKDDKNKLEEEIYNRVNKHVKKDIDTGINIIPVSILHNIVELSLDEINEKIAKSYRDYRDYKISFVRILDNVFKKAQAINYIGDKDNANTDSALVSTKRSLIYNQLNKELYQKFNMTPDELQACNDGYIYIHDMVARRDTFNCCLYDIESVLTGGFEMGNVWYNEPKTIDTAFDVIGDIVLSAAAQQYGGFTIPEIDKILVPYAKKSFIAHMKDAIELIYTDREDLKLMYMSIVDANSDKDKNINNIKEIHPVLAKVYDYAIKKLEKDIEQGFQGWEYKFNTVGSSRGDYPFITITFGLETSMFGRMINKICLNTRRNGQGKDGFKKPVLFPKLTFLYDKNLHGEGKELEDVFMAAIDCSQKTMYPDYLSLTGDGYIPSIYKKYGKAISLMGCVHGSSSVKVCGKSINDHCVIYEDNIEKLWNIISKNSNYKPIQQIDGDDRFSYIEFNNPIDLQVWDNKVGTYVGVKKFVRNITNKWIKIKLYNDYELICTPDHPLPVLFKGRTRADEICVNDELIIDNSDNRSSRVASITTISCDQEYSYDFETETDHFTVNSIYSHNCRASLSPWYEKGGMEPADETDIPIFTGRFNMGAVTLHLPMILAKSREENRDFYEVLNYYMEMIRTIHKRTYKYLGKMKASTNPLAYCEGGIYGGHLQPNETIEKLLAPMTMSFGITALNELQVLYNGKTIREDGKFALEVMEWINKKIDEYKHEDNILYAIYGTPAETLAGLQAKQFKNKYGIIKGVSDRGYVTNSFHCHVSEEMDPIEKQDKEKRFWDLFNGGKIQYCKYPINYNKEAMITLIRRAMDMGFYEGVNLSLAYCEDCGHEELSMDVCPKCGSKNLTKIERMNGYLGYSRVKGQTRFNDSKMEEFKDRISM